MIQLDDDPEETAIRTSNTAPQLESGATKEIARDSTEAEDPDLGRNDDHGGAGMDTDVEPPRAPVTTEQTPPSIPQQAPPTPLAPQLPTQQPLVQAQAPPPPVPPPQPPVNPALPQDRTSVQKPTSATAKPTPKTPPAPGAMVLQKPSTKQELEIMRAKAAYSTHDQLNKQLAARTNIAGFVPMKTLSGRSLGELGKYSMDWNNADMQEASSSARIPAYPLLQLLDGKPVDPASPITVGQLMYATKAAMLELDRVVEVKFPSSLIPSPRDSGGVTCHLT